LPTAAGAVGTEDASALARHGQVALEDECFAAAAAETPLDQREVVRAHRPASGVGNRTWSGCATVVRIPSSAGLLARFEADPDFHELAGVHVVQPCLEALDLGDARADAVRSGDGNLPTVSHLLEERAGVSDEVFVRPEPHEADAVCLAEGKGCLLEVAVRRGPLQREPSGQRGVPDIDEDDCIEGEPLVQSQKEQGEAVGSSSVAEDASVVSLTPLYNAEPWPESFRRP